MPICKRFRSTLAAAMAMVGALACGLPGHAADCPGSAIEGWDDGDAGGWIGSSGAAITVMATGGNPDGYISVEDSGLTTIQVEIPPWTGDYGSAGIRTILFDLQLFGSGTVTGPLIRMRQDGFSNGWYYFFGDTVAVDGQWHSYAAQVDARWTDKEAVAAGWWTPGGDTEPTFSAVMANVGILVVGAGDTTTGEFVGLDNVQISCQLFADGFESGDTENWSSAIP